MRVSKGAQARAAKATVYKVPKHGVFTSEMQLCPPVRAFPPSVVKAARADMRRAIAAARAKGLT